MPCIFKNCTSWFKNSLHTYCLFKEWNQKKPGHILQTIFLPDENFIRYFNINVMDVTLYNHSMHVLFLLSFWSLWWRMRLLLLLFGAPAGWGNITPGIGKCLQLLSWKSYFSLTSYTQYGPIMNGGVTMHPDAAVCYTTILHVILVFLLS